MNAQPDDDTRDFYAAAAAGLPVLGPETLYPGESLGPDYLTPSQLAAWAAQRMAENDAMLAQGPDAGDTAQAASWPDDDDDDAGSWGQPGPAWAPAASLPRTGRMIAADALRAIGGRLYRLAERLDGFPF